MLDKLFVTVFRLHRIARSASITISTDLLLACYLANVTCTITNIMTALIFIIVSWFPVVVARSCIHVLVAVAVNPCFQQAVLFWHKRLGETTAVIPVPLDAF